MNENEKRIKKLWKHIEDKFNPLFAPLQEKANQWLMRRMEDISIYFGTYFLRSVVESNTTFERYLSSDTEKANLKNLVECHFISIGSGCGGDTIGFIEAFEKNYSNRIVKIHLIDGNKCMLDSGFEVINFHLTNNKWNNEYEICTPICEVISTSNSISEILKNNYGEMKTFDFISSSKICNEQDFVNYREFFEGMLTHLNENSLFIITVNSSKRTREGINKYEWEFLLDDLEDYFNSPNALKFIFPLCLAKRSFKKMKILKENNQECLGNCRYNGSTLSQTCSNNWIFLIFKSKLQEETFFRLVAVKPEHALKYLEEMFFFPPNCRIITNTFKDPSKNTKCTVNCTLEDLL